MPVPYFPTAGGAIRFMPVPYFPTDGGAIRFMNLHTNRGHP